jgi:hypothetical protein
LPEGCFGAEEQAAINGNTPNKKTIFFMTIPLNIKKSGGQSTGFQLVYRSVIVPISAVGGRTDKDDCPKRKCKKHDDTDTQVGIAVEVAVNKDGYAQNTENFFHRILLFHQVDSSLSCA